MENNSVEKNNYTPPTLPPRKPTIQKESSGLLYISPFLLVAQWLAVYMVVVRHFYGQVVTLIEWIQEDPLVIIDILKDADAMLEPWYMIYLLKGYNYLTLGGIIACLFFIGYRIHNKRPAKNAGAKLHDKEPYILTMSLMEEIKLIENADAKKAGKAVHLLNERLRNESAFGEGSNAVADCENQIAAYIQEMEDLIPCLRDEGTAAEAAQNIETLCQRCMNKLKVRIELKKK